MISGLQVAFLLFHNRVVDKLRDDGEDRGWQPRLGSGRRQRRNVRKMTGGAPSSWRRAAWSPGTITGSSSTSSCPGSSAHHS